MYLESFKLTEPPFRLSPDPAFLYLSKDHSRAKAYMESTVWFTDGFVIITGEIGAGKTTLIESFLRELDKNVLVAQVNQTQISPVEFLQIVLSQFGLKPFKMKKAQLLATLNDFLIEQYAAGRKVLLIIDEAQNLSSETLEEVRLLSGIETTKEKVLRIILAGQPELNDKLDSPELVQLVQRVRLRFHLKALDPDDLRAYVLHRLEVAGSNGREIFAEDCYPIIFRYTGGVPRLINSLCDTSMMSAFAEDRDHVLLADVESAIAELRWSEFKERVLPGRKSQASADETGRHARGGEAADAAEHSEQTGKFAPAAAVPVARLVVVADGRTICEKPLQLGRTLIGRTPENDLQIDSRFVSRHHCQILTKPHTCVVEDLNSTNGILVKSRRVRSHNLNDGDVITIGRHELIYIDERQARPGETDSHPVMVEPDDPPESESPDAVETSAQDDKTQVM
jgi:type II secretory pathway predicted ATPase ExeA